MLDKDGVCRVGISLRGRGVDDMTNSGSHRSRDCRFVARNTLPDSLGAEDEQARGTCKGRWQGRRVGEISMAHADSLRGDVGQLIRMTSGGDYLIYRYTC